ncbi:MAG: MFS transporter [Bacillota bacterium]|nr:MFS transporter [Bacillota bacterium]
MRLKLKKLPNLEYNLYINNINGILQALSLNLVVPYASIYTKRLGGGDRDIALLNSYPAIFCLFAVFFGTYLYRKFKNKKKITSIFFLLSRSFFLIFIIIPFLPSGFQPGIFVLLYGMMNFPNSIATMGWQSYIGDLFNGNWRGRALSKRNTLSTISALIVTFTAGNILYYIPKTNSDRMKLYQIFFAIAFVIAVFEVYSLTIQHLDKNSIQLEKVTSLEDKKFIDKLKEILNMFKGNKPFLNFSLCVIFFHFTWQMGWPIFFTYEYDVLHSNEFWTSISSTANCIFQAVTFILWQKYSEKKGNKLLIFYAAMLMAITPFAYLISRSMIHIALLSIVSGSAVSGTTLLLLNNLYETVPDADRTTYIALYTIITNITLMFAPVLGMRLKAAMNIYFALLIVGILRILASFAFYLRYRKYKNKSLA